MVGIVFTGSAGRLEGRYEGQEENSSPPLALFLHPHPLYGGTMNNKVIYRLYRLFHRHGFACLRFNFRSAESGQNNYDKSTSELADAAAALDWLQMTHPKSSAIWVVGYSFGSWVGMQLLMRRPEVTYFVSLAPPVQNYDFSFLAPCPNSGLIVQAEEDSLAPTEMVNRFAEKLQSQEGITIDYEIVQGADHLFKQHLPQVESVIESYITRYFEYDPLNDDEAGLI